MCPSQIKINKFQNLQISDFDETEMEVAEWENFANVLTAFGRVTCRMTKRLKTSPTTTK
jgi:hypothetical protein